MKKRLLTKNKTDVPNRPLRWLRSLSVVIALLTFVSTSIASNSLLKPTLSSLSADMLDVHDINGAAELINKMLEADFTVQERLRIYDQIPHYLLDITDRRIRVEVASPTIQDIPYLTEFLYLLAINERLTTSLWTPWKKIQIERGLRVRFARTLSEWQFNLGKQAFTNPGEGPNIYLDQTKIDERIEAFAKALLAGLTGSEIARIRKMEAKWLAERRRDLSNAVESIPYPDQPSLQMQKGRHSEGPFFMAIGGMMSPIGLISIISMAAGHGPGGAGFLGLGGLALAAIGYAIHSDANTEVRAQFERDKLTYQQYLDGHRTKVASVKKAHANDTARLGMFFDHTLKRPLASRCAGVLSRSNPATP